MRQALLLPQGLQLAMAVGHADRADVIALGEEQLKDGLAMLLQALRRRGDFHSFFDGGDAGGQQLVAALDLDQAQAARAHIAQPIEMAERRDVDVVFARDFKNGLAGAGADFLTVDGECFDVNGRLMPTPQTGEWGGWIAGFNDRRSMLQTPAGTAFVHDVVDVLVLEVLQRAQHRIGRGHAQAAEAGLLDRRAEIDEQIEVGHGSLPRADAGEDV